MTVLFRRRKTRWQRFTERMADVGGDRKRLGKRALGVAGGAAGLVAASAATSSLRAGHRGGT
jgi:hypothetical protein